MERKVSLVFMSLILVREAPVLPVRHPDFEDKTLQPASGRGGKAGFPEIIDAGRYFFGVNA